MGEKMKKGRNYKKFSCEFKNESECEDELEEEGLDFDEVAEEYFEDEEE